MLALQRSLAEHYRGTQLLSSALVLLGSFNLAIRCLVWERLAWAFCRCRRSNLRVALSKRLSRALRGKDSTSMSTLAAARTWQMVISGFFPPKPKGLPSREQVTHLGNIEVAMNRLIVPHFKVAQAQ